jgi:hypothetical protein
MKHARIKVTALTPNAVYMAIFSTNCVGNAMKRGMNNAWMRVCRKTFLLVTQPGQTTSMKKFATRGAPRVSIDNESPFQKKLSARPLKRKAISLTLQNEMYSIQTNSIYIILLCLR